MTTAGEEFHPEYIYADRRTTYWCDLIDSRWYKWYDSEREAMQAIINHKKMDEYVPRVIYVR